MAFRAFFDESGVLGTDRVMAIAGLMGEAQVLAQLSDAWWCELKNERSGGMIKFFTADHARGLTGQFSHWRGESRNQKVEALTRLLGRDGLTEVVAAVNLDAFKRVSERWPKREGKHGFNLPYLLCFWSVLSATAKEAIDLGSNEPTEVVFDNFDKYRLLVREIYPSIYAQFGPLHRTLALDPRFEDDRRVAPLQAADLLASEARLAGNTRDQFESWTRRWCPRLRVSSHSVLFDEARLEAFERGFIEWLQRT